MKPITKEHKPYNPYNLYNNKGVHKENMEFTPSKPDYSGNGVAIWNATDKNGKTYLKVVILGGKAVNCFAYDENYKKE